jgi:uncharacterized membrane protein
MSTLFLNNILFPSLLASLGWGIAPILDKEAMLINNNFKFIFSIKLIFISILTILVLAFLYKSLKKNYSEVPKKYRIKLLLLLFFSAISSFILGYYFYFKALSNCKSTTLVVLLTYVLPLLLVSILSSIFFKEKFNCGMIVGLLLSIMGICVFTYYSKS